MTDSGSIRLFVDPALRSAAALARRGLEQLLRIAGWQTVEAKEPGAADLVYSPLGAATFDGAVPSAGESAWRDVVTSHPVRIGDLVLPSQAVLPTQRGREPAIDLPLAAHFFLCGMHERDPQVHRSSDGIPDGSIGKWGLLECPVVDCLSQRLSEYFTNVRNLPTPAPRWPGGREWAVCLTHDCDRPFRYRAAGYLLDLGLAARRRAWSLAASHLLKAAYSGAMFSLRPDPYFNSWRSWTCLERQLGIRSTFYIGTWTRYERDADERDVGYSCYDRRIRTLASELADGGWELGLHSSIRAWRRPTGFADEVERFQRAFRVRPSGFRSHYWSLDPVSPERSLQQAHEQAGFLYDSSFGMNLAFGYRRGTSFPYRPIDPASGKEVGLWEIPPTIMDGATLAGTSCSSERKLLLRGLFEATKRRGALLVLDWHEHSLASGVILGADLIEVLGEFVGDSTCWWTTPSAVVEWASKDRWTRQ
jgi:hypothetical protein